MFGRIFWPAIIAGMVAGLFLFAAHIIWTTPLILFAEGVEASVAGQSGAAAAPGPAAVGTALDDEDFLIRSAYTLMADLLTSTGFAFLLVGAMSLYRGEVDWQRGMIWGACGYAAFFAAPAFGLPPLLPGMAMSDPVDRQIWWLATAAATALGLSGLILGRSGSLRLAGAVVILLPHLVGAPQGEEFSYDLPAQLVSRFAVATLVVSGLFWLLLGGLSGYFLKRFDR